MANHIYNGILETILTKSKSHRTIDFIIALTDLAQQVKVGKERTDYKFIVPCYSNSPHGLWNEIDLKFPNLINKTTTYDCVKELKELNIIEYNEELNGFELLHMENMLKKKDKGYTDIRKFFFTDSFIKIPYVEKRALLYMLYLLDKKKSSRIFKRDYGVDIICNLNNYRKSFKEDELNWMTVCRTSNIYYVKKIFDSLCTNYLDIIESKTKEFRIAKYGKETGIARGICLDVIYFFNIKSNLKDKNYNESEEVENLSKRFPKVNELINDICKKEEISINIQSKLALLRRVYKFLPYAQENIIKKVVKRIGLSITDPQNRIRNIEAFVQHIVNTSSFIRHATYHKPYERGILEDLPIIPF